MDNALRKAKHEAELKKLAATTVNVMTTAGGTTNTANPSGGGSVAVQVAVHPVAVESTVEGT